MKRFALLIALLCCATLLFCACADDTPQTPAVTSGEAPAATEAPTGDQPANTTEPGNNEGEGEGNGNGNGEGSQVPEPEEETLPWGDADGNPDNEWSDTYPKP